MNTEDQDRERGDRICREDDGCPTEVAVLQREWRSMWSLLQEWEDGVYDNPDFLRRVRLTLHGKDGLRAVTPNYRYKHAIRCTQCVRATRS